MNNLPHHVRTLFTLKILLIQKYQLKEEMVQEEPCSTLETIDLSDLADWTAVLTTSLRNTIVR